MTHSSSIAAYMYAAELVCPDCITVIATEQIEKLDEGASARGTCDGFPDQLVARWARRANIDINDEHSYDSDTFPKVVFADQVDEGETCARCHEELS